MKYIALFFLFACNHVCPPPVKIVTHYDTIGYPVIDTLVIIQTYDTAERITIYDTGFIRFGGSSWEMRPTKLFKDGKRCDTIYKNTTIYK